MTKRMPLCRLAALLFFPLLIPSLFAAETFEVDAHKAVIHPAAKPAAGKPWLWYAPALKGGVSIVQHKLYADACQQAIFGASNIFSDTVPGLLSRSNDCP